MKEVGTKLLMAFGYLIYAYGIAYLINLLTDASFTNALVIALITVVLVEMGSLRYKYNALNDKQDQDLKQLKQLQWKLDILEKSFKTHKDIDELRFTSAKITDMQLAMNIKQLKRQKGDE